MSVEKDIIFSELDKKKSLEKDKINLKNKKKNKKSF